MKYVKGLGAAAAVLAACAAVGQEPIAPMMESRSGHVLAEVPGGLLAAGGFDGGVVTSSCERYEVATGAWSAAASLPGPRRGATAHAVGGAVFLVGGEDGGGGLPTAVLRYAPEADVWEAVAELGTGRTGHASAVLPSGKVLVCGGYDGAVDLASCETFDPQTYEVAPAASLATGRSSFVLLGIDGNAWQGLLAVGGFNPAAGFQLASTERYDPIEDVWTPDADLPTAVDNLAGASLYGRPIVTGGRVYDPVANAFAGTATGAIYDYPLAQWVPFDLVGRHSYHAMAVRINAWWFEAVVCGGADATGVGVAPTYSPSEHLLLGLNTPPDIFDSALLAPDVAECAGRYQPAYARSGAFGYFTGGDPELVGTGWRIDLTDIGSAGTVTAATSDLFVFPNPAHGRVALVGLREAAAGWDVLASDGRILASGRGPALDTAGLPAGLLLVRETATGRTARLLVS